MSRAIESSTEQSTQPALSRLASSPSVLARMSFGAVILLGVLVGWGTADLGTADAYSTCLHPDGYCGSHFYSGVSFADSSGWSGSKATAITNSGAAWSSSYVGVSQTVTCPCNALVYLVNFGSYIAPGATHNWYQPGDPYEIVYSEIYLNSLFTWYTDGTMNLNNHYADVRTVTLHEMGHMLGLAHDCTYTSAVMCVTWTSKWNPQTDDWNGINALY